MSNVLKRPVDLLLLNTSNYPPKAVYPYAFVQVSAVARRFGLRVARFDFVGLDKHQAYARLTTLLRQHQPRMIGIHLRQTDTVVESDYRPPPEGAPSKYFLPVDDTRDLVREIRARTRTPIVVGGFGFSTHALRIAKQLGVDFGVQGEPDGFFEHFEDVLSRRALDQVPNLIYRRAGAYRANPRVYFPPSAEPEYTAEVIDELARFRREHPSDDKTLPHAPIEVSRGCPHHCYFCCEPAVKGRKVRIRDWAAVEQDIRALDRRGIRRIWFVCSEINFDRKFPSQIARRMAALNRDRADARKIHWRAYNLPRTSRGDLRAMMAAGFEPGWNDFVSFEDRNLRRCRVPYRAADAIAYCRDFHALARAFSLEIEEARTFYMFFGNAFADGQAIHTTLRLVDRHGLQALHDKAAVTSATRVFQVAGRYNCGTGKSMFTVGRRGKQPLDIVRPTFHYPQNLVDKLGSQAAVREFLDYLGATFLSTAHCDERNALAFLRRNTTVARLRKLMVFAKEKGYLKPVDVEADSDPTIAKRVERTLARLWAKLDPVAVRELFRPRAENSVMRFVANAVLIQLFRPNAVAFKRVFRHLGVPCDGDGFYALSEYRIAEILYRRYRSNDQLVDDVRRKFGFADDSLDLLHLRYFLFENNVRIRPEYRPLLFGQV